MKRLIAILLSTAVILSCFVACSKTKPENENTATVPPAIEQTSDDAIKTTAPTTEEPATEKQTESTAEESTTEKTTSGKVRTTNPDKSISVNEAFNYLSDFYGKSYTINATIKEDGIQYFKVFDKKGNLYSRVSVDLDNSKMTETIVDSGEINEFTIH